MYRSLTARCRLARKRFYVRRQAAAGLATILAGFVFVAVGPLITATWSDDLQLASAFWALYFMCDVFWPFGTTWDRPGVEADTRRREAEKRVMVALEGLRPLLPRPTLRCPHCDAAFWWSDQKFDSRMNCPSCGKDLRISLIYLRLLGCTSVGLGALMASWLTTDAFWMLMLFPFTILFALAVTPMIAQHLWASRLHVHSREDVTQLHIQRLGE